MNESTLEVLQILGIISITTNLGYHKTIQWSEKSTSKVSISLCKEDFIKLWEDLLNQDSLTLLVSGIKIFQRTKSLLCLDVLISTEFISKRQTALLRQCYTVCSIDMVAMLTTNLKYSTHAQNNHGRKMNIMSNSQHYPRFYEYP